MSQEQVHDILRKISYIEADIEIQKQILYSIPSDQQQEMEKTIALIAKRKQEIDVLRQQIKAVDPEEYERIMVLEKAAEQFRKLAQEKTFEEVVSRQPGTDCAITLTQGEVIECIVKARENTGDWTVITLEGEVRSIPASMVAR